MKKKHATRHKPAGWKLQVHEKHLTFLMENERHNVREKKGGF